jgi:hypothetical protein
MAQPKALENAPILHLLVQLLKEGRAAILPDLAPLEPIDIDLIVATLRQRTGQDHLGRDFPSWYCWFMQHYRDASEHERQSLRLMTEMVKSTEFFVDRLSKRGVPPPISN